jgi:hypothetical protein
MRHGSTILAQRFGLMHDGMVAEAGDRPDIRADVSLHILGSGGVLFDGQSQRLYGANTTATFIWCHLEDGLEPAAIAKRVRDVFGMSAAEATANVGLSLRQWRELGLIGTYRASASLFNADEPPSRVRRQPSSTAAPAIRRAAIASRHYRLLDTTFRLSFSSRRLLSEVDPVLTPILDVKGRPSEELQLVAARDRIALCHGGVAIDDCSSWDGIVPMLKAALVLFALDRSDDFAAIHSAALAKGKHCFLIPGESGQGKSTLSAALIAAGFRLLGDDTIVLARDTLDARAIPFSICLKEGSWPLLASQFPALAQRPVHNRSDGKIVRYLVPSRKGGWAKPSFRTPIDGIVLLDRGTDKTPGITPLDPVEAFPRFLQDFYPLRGGLDAEKVGTLVRWISNRRCVELHYDTLEQGVALMTKLCP